MPEGGIQGPGEFRTASLQLVAVRHGEFPKQCPAGGGEPDPDFPFVLRAWSPEDRAAVLQAVYKLDSAVMLNKQAAGQFANGGLHALGESANSEQELMLLGFEAVLFGGGFTEMEEAPDLAPEFGEVAVLLEG